jgi:hypothetical protein
MINTRSKKRVRDYGEVLTPKFIVNDMLDLVKEETENINSRFLEPACGDGNFLIKILERKLEVVKRVYKKSQFDYEINSLVAVSNIYGVELLDDNVQLARKRLYSFFLNEYEKLYKEKINSEFLKSIIYILERNTLQGDALTLRNHEGKPVVFSEWSLINGIKIKRKDFQFIDLTEFNPKTPPLPMYSVREISDTGEKVFTPKPIKDFPIVNFMNIYRAYE